MARTILTITSTLFDEGDQEVSIRENLPVRTLLAEANQEFSLEEGTYNLSLKGNGKVLEPDKTLEQQGVQTGAVLVLNRERRAPMFEAFDDGNQSRVAISGKHRAFLREVLSNQAFDIKFQPAIIGRPDAANPSTSEILAVDLGPFEGARNVSRFHARITEQNGNYYLEPMAEHNPTYLNNIMLRLGERRALEPGDKIRVGKISLVFGIK